MPSNFRRNFNKIIDNIIGVFVELGDFIISLLEFFAHKIDSLLGIIHLVIVKNIDLIVSLKFRTAGRLIWSRGRLSTKFRLLSVITFTFMVFMIGGVFQTKFVVEDNNYTSAFLTTSNSILAPHAKAATYTGESTLLDQPKEHVVLEGESLASIAQNYGISLESVKFANNLTYNSIKVGQKLKIPPVEGTLHTVVKGDTIDKLAKKYDVPSQTIVDFNYLDAPYTLEVGMILTIPDARQPEAERFYAGNNVYDTSSYGLIPYAGNVVEGSGNFIWPLGGIISQGFHRYHPAIDIANNSGDIIAADKGTVIRAGWWQGGYGNAVQIDHGNGLVTTYAHMSTISVSNGESVEKGQKIGVVGSTGRSTGPHLHFTVQKDGAYLDPMGVLPR